MPARTTEASTEYARHYRATHPEYQHDSCPDCGERKYKTAARCRRCAAAAARGDGHSQWRGDQASVKSGRARAKRRYPLGPCEQCGQPATERHHRDENTLNNAPENIAILCRRCHMTLDGRLAALVASQVRFGPGPQKTHCVQGHELTPTNTVPVKGGGRRCRTCVQGYQQRRTARRAAGA
jgi:hypothetical protein